MKIIFTQGDIQMYLEVEKNNRRQSINCLELVQMLDFRY